jgi:uncharacterized protein (DUF2235 family)
MERNIVVCCDGTGNEYGADNSNVVKLFGIVEKNSARQIAYYDPGVGTLSMPGIFSTPAKKVSKLFGLAFGLGFTEHLEDAYKYLMDHYQDRDRIWLFGFSRGAFTVRALAGMIYKCGLLARGSDNLIPYASKMYKYEKCKEISEGFKRTYSRAVPIYFLGIWDTVKSLGNVYNPLNVPHTFHNPAVQNVRHAMSIDERRCYYRQNLWGPLPQQNVKQVWFAGVHSDVGGSYPEQESGLSKIALKWMVDEAEKFGLQVDPKQRAVVIPEIAAPNQEFVPPNDRGILHPSLHGAWWILEYIPKLYENMSQTPPRKALTMYRGRRRYIAPGSVVHHTVVDRIRDVSDYKPPNLPDNYGIEP